MAKNLFSGWKKFSSNGKNTIMAHPSGHKMIIQHKHLKPEHLEQLHALPFAGAGKPEPTKMADGGRLKPTKDDIPEPNKKAASDMQKGAMSGGPSASQAWGNLKSGLGFAEGGQVGTDAIKKENYSQGFKKEQPGVVYDTETPSDQWDESKRPTQSNPKLEESKKQPPAAPEEYDPYQDPAFKPKKMADGGEVAETPAAPTGLEATTAPAVSPDATVPASDTAAQPTPEPAQVDPELQQKRALYNSIVAGPVGAKTGAPDADNAPAKQFGPNGEAPKQFDAGAWRQAQQNFTTAQANKAQEQNTQAAATIEENKARAAAGLAPLPVPAAQLAAKQDPALQGQVAAQEAPKAPGDPYGTQAYSDAYVKGVNEQKAGMAQEGAASAKLGNAEAAALQKGQQVQQAALQNYQTHYQNLENERQSLIHDINNQHIDPKHFVNTMDGASKVATAIGLIASGFGSGVTGQENLAMKFLNQQIDRDIDAQKANLNKSESLLSANMKQFGSLHDATAMTRVMQSDILSNQLKMEAAKAQGPLAKARLLQAAGQLDQQSAPVMSQIAMRKTLLSGMQAGHVRPEQVIRAIVPEKEQSVAYKELGDAQKMVKLKDQALSAFDQIAAINTAGNRILNPVQSKSQIAKIVGAIVPTISKESAGRYTESDAAAIEHVLVSTPWDDAKSREIGRRELDRLMSGPMNFPLLKAYGIDAAAQGRYNSSGQSKIQESAPVTK